MLRPEIARTRCRFGNGSKGPRCCSLLPRVHADRFEDDAVAAGVGGSAEEAHADIAWLGRIQSAGAGPELLAAELDGRLIPIDDDADEVSFLILGQFRLRLHPGPGQD